MSSIDRKTFERFRDLIYEKSGIALGAKKEALLTARISKRMRALQIEDYKSYLDYVLNDSTGNEIVQLLDAISTNVTSFFREPDHFDFMTEILQKWVNEGQRKFRFWSAASSTGEEPYTIVMTFSEVIDPSLCDVRLLATDISTRVLEKAIRGEYDEEKVQTVPTVLLHKYFDRIHSTNGTVYRVRQELKRLVAFRRLNLSVTPFPMRGPFDVVFCRNVMIYFDNEVRRKLLNEIYRLLKPGGYLMVGHAESLTGMMSEFKTVRPSIYVK